MKFDAPEEIGGGNFLKAPGTYHLHIIQVLEDQYSDGKLIDGGGFSVAMDCLDGTVREGDKCTEVGKTLNMTFYNGRLTDKDKGLFARERQAAFLISTNVITPDQLGKSIDIDLQKSVGHSVVMALELDKEGKYLRLERSACYHVDDPRVSGVPKCATAMKLIAAANRHPKEWFDQLMKKKAKPAGGGGNGSTGGGSGNGGSGAPVGAGASSGGGLSQAELDNL